MDTIRKGPETGKADGCLTLQELREAMTSQIEWITKLQTPGGAIRDSLKLAKLSPDRYRITPYNANTAAIALTRHPHCLKNVESYIQWYLSHLNEPDSRKVRGQLLYGTIYDYHITPDNLESSTQDYDSADSYAATFISLVRAYCENGGSRDFILANKDKLINMANTMASLMDKDFLTWAKPNFRVKYLMDNCEVYKGFKDMEYLCNNVFSDFEAAERYKDYANRIKSAIFHTLKNENEFYEEKWLWIFRWKVNWKKWYPDSTSQIFPVIFGLLPPSSPMSSSLFNKLNIHWDWPNLQTGDPFPWVLTGYAAAVMGKREETELFYRNLVSTFMGRENETHWYSLEAGWFVLMVEKMISNGWYCLK